MKAEEYIIPINETAKDYDEMFVGVIRRQPVLIRCKDCKYYGADEETLYCERLDLLDFPGHSETSFCSWAERKEE